MGYTVIKQICLLKQHKPTFKTTHYSEGNVVGKPFKLQIVKYSGDEGVYLIYLDNKGNELTDTYHNDILEAFKQADWEYNIKEEDWKTVF